MGSRRGTMSNFNYRTDDEGKMLYANNTESGDSGTGIYSPEGCLIGIHGGHSPDSNENYGFIIEPHWILLF